MTESDHELDNNDGDCASLEDYWEHPSDWRRLPAEIWSLIFTFVPPQSWLRLIRTHNSFWKLSFFPEPDYEKMAQAYREKVNPIGKFSPVCSLQKYRELGLDGTQIKLFRCRVCQTNIPLKKINKHQQICRKITPKIKNLLCSICGGYQDHIPYSLPYQRPPKWRKWSEEQKYLPCPLQKNIRCSSLIGCSNGIRLSKRCLRTSESYRDYCFFIHYRFAVEKHFQYDHQRTRITCEWCQLNLPISQLQYHLILDCPEIRIGYCDCCGYVPRKKEKIHKSTCFGLREINKFPLYYKYFYV